MIVGISDLKINIDKDILEYNQIEIDFNGEYIIQFEKQQNGSFEVISAVDHYGEDKTDYFEGEELVIIEE